MVDEKKLLEGLKKKRKNSIEQAIEIYTPYLATVLYNMIGSSLPHEDVEEIVSDVFIMLWKNADHIDLSKGTLRGYCAASARNFALKKLEKQKRYAKVPSDFEHTFYLSEKEEKDQLWEAVMSLGDPDNEIFVRFYKYGERLSEIASATGLNLSTVKSKLSRGKVKLKKILTDAEENNE